MSGADGRYVLLPRRARWVLSYFFIVSTSYYVIAGLMGTLLQNLYIASYVHSIEGMDPEAGNALIQELQEHVKKPKYRVTVEWKDVGDMIIWDNTSTLHRATGGSYEGKWRRDMRRTTVKDMSSTKYGLNGEGADWRVGLP